MKILHLTVLFVGLSDLFCRESCRNRVVWLVNFVSTWTFRRDPLLTIKFAKRVREHVQALSVVASKI